MTINQQDGEATGVQQDGETTGDQSDGYSRGIKQNRHVTYDQSDGYSRGTKQNEQIADDQGDGHTTKDYEAMLGLLKLKRMRKSRRYNVHGYHYKNELQLQVLNDVLKLTLYPTSQTRNALGILLNLNPRSVQIWFQNARQISERSVRNESKTQRISKNIDLDTLISIFLKNTRK
ncbi:hypothetical protein PAEPH01_0566 [Pancytospora epiphaga]|nr:hypothetical protein PAEPH01_0566 [Pancytospora epiphaga]